MRKLTVNKFFEVFIFAFKDFKRNEPLRLAGATAFFTTFALPAILIILVQFIGLIFSKESLRSKLFSSLSKVLGHEGAMQIQQTFWGFQSLATNRFITVAGFLFLIFVATTLFKIIRDSLNQLWNVRVPDNKPVLQLAGRFHSLIIILLAGLLFISAMVAEGAEAILHRYTGSWHSLTGNFFSGIINQFIAVIIVTSWFSVLFKMLPDAKASWRVVIPGGLFTGILFSIGKIIIRTALSAGNLNNIFGASSSIVLLLLFVFYCSFILYYGACFTKAYALFVNNPIKAAPYAIKYKLVEVKSE